MSSDIREFAPGCSSTILSDEAESFALLCLAATFILLPVCVVTIWFLGRRKRLSPGQVIGMMLGTFVLFFALWPPFWGRRFRDLNEQTVTELFQFASKHLLVGMSEKEVVKLLCDPGHLHSWTNSTSTRDGVVIEETIYTEMIWAPYTVWLDNWRFTAHFEDGNLESFRKEYHE